MKRFTGSDIKFMSRALHLAWAVKGTTFPNPAVGAVVVKGGRVVGEGATQAAGKPHAEIMALAQAGKRAHGATLYVGLEPCCHQGRTGPCTTAIINAGIGEVVAATADPNPVVNGKGFGRLRRAGVRVRSGLLEQAARRINEDFFFAVATGRAFISLKLGLTLDGRIADAHGRSRWITGSGAREFGHELRRLHAAVAVGGATVAADDPRLTVRHKKGFSPARIVFTSRPHLLRNSFLARHGREVRTIAVVPGRGRRRVEHDPLTGIECWYTGKGPGAAHLAAFAAMAYSNDITSVLIEGGQKLASGFLEHGLVNRVWLCYGNKLFGGGTEGFLFSKGLRVEKSMTLKDRRVFELGDTVVISGIPAI